jgi:hypothetical protein
MSDAIAKLEANRSKGEPAIGVKGPDYLLMENIFFVVKPVVAELEARIAKLEGASTSMAGGRRTRRSRRH